MAFKKHNKLCEVCPRKLSTLPSSPCPMALERIHSIQAVESEGKRRRETEDLPGCPWYTTSSEHNNCFWSLVSTPDGNIEGFSDKEVCDLLMLTQTQADKSLQSALNKLRNIKDTDMMQELREMIYDKLASVKDDTVYYPDKFNEIIEKSSLTEEEESDEDEDLINEAIGKKSKKSKKKKIVDKVHLYGLYSNKTLERIKREKNGTYTSENDTEE